MLSISRLKVKWKRIIHVFITTKDKGFTLIEIIAVLVILGILAAVAIPQYTGLQNSARTMSAQAAIAEMMARANAEYANQVMACAVTPACDVTAIDPTAVTSAVQAMSNGNGDDYDASFNGSITCTVTHVQGTLLDGGGVSKDWIKPVF